MPVLLNNKRTNIITSVPLLPPISIQDPNSRGEVHVDDFVDWWKGFINDFEDEADADR